MVKNKRRSVHPITNKVLDAQRAALVATMNCNTSLEVQRRVARELAWHALFTASSLEPDMDMVAFADYCREAILRGCEYGLRVQT